MNIIVEINLNLEAVYAPQMLNTINAKTAIAYNDISIVYHHSKSSISILL